MRFQSTPTPRGVGDSETHPRRLLARNVSIHSYPAWGRRRLETPKIVEKLAVSIHSYPAWGRRLDGLRSHRPCIVFQSTPTPRGVGDTPPVIKESIPSLFQSTPTPRGVGDL